LEKLLLAHQEKINPSKTPYFLNLAKNSSDTSLGCIWVLMYADSTYVGLDLWLNVEMSMSYAVK